MVVIVVFVKELCECIGVGMLDCKKVLVEIDGDIELVIENMCKLGQVKVVKKVGCIVVEGVILIKVEGGKVIIFELNCEIDFVVCDEGFLVFGNKLLDVVFVNSLSDIEVLNVFEIEGGVVSDVCDILVVKIGENIFLCCVLIVEGNNLGVYIYGVCIGVLVIFEGGEEELVKDVVMYVVVFVFQFVKFDQVLVEVVEKEKVI